ncbi:hypothetical protein B0H11DRAFT_2279308 [Mycena galericulata]|nr:hypothetical protein B0H11DRAFT_2279308 [Mycena galericulata]
MSSPRLPTSTFGYGLDFTFSLPVASRERDQEALDVLNKARRRLAAADEAVATHMARLDLAWGRIREYGLLPSDGRPATRREFDALAELEHREHLRRQAQPGQGRLRPKKGKGKKAPSSLPVSVAPTDEKVKGVKGHRQRGKQPKANGE